MSDTFLAKSAIRKAFPGINDTDVEAMLTISSLMEYAPETWLCNEGEIEETFYILLDGDVRVTKEINSDEDRLLNTLTAGDFFGEMGLIHDAPRAASVITNGDVKVLEIDKSSFNQTLQKMSMVSVAMVREVSQRLRDNDELAIEDLREKAGELADAYQQLAELDVARREFLTTIAHELRTPLTSANGFLQMVQMGMLQGDSLDQALDSIAGNIKRIIGLTNDILFLQEMDLIFSDFEGIDLAELFKRLIEEYREMADQMGVNIRLVIDGVQPTVVGDEKSIERTFRALLDNAIKFSLNGGDVLVHISVDRPDVLVSIQDEGIGISEENLPRIFERFWRTEEHNGHLFGGIGLGLAIAKQVVEQHGGEIFVESKPDKGSSFKVTMPQQGPAASDS